jgi:hypothetical protein
MIGDFNRAQLEKVPLGLVYDASVHGWSPAAFHQQLDGMGAALLVAQTESGTIFGGYNPKGWLGYGDWRDAISAFLFTWLDGDTSGATSALHSEGHQRGRAGRTPQHGELLTS